MPFWLSLLMQLRICCPVAMEMLDNTCILIKGLIISMLNHCQVIAKVVSIDWSLKLSILVCACILYEQAIAIKSMACN